MDKPDNDNPIIYKNWEEFQSSGLLWFVNSILHVFGWAIVLQHTPNAYGYQVTAYPARVSFRGFDDKATTAGHKKVASYLAENAEDLKKESEM